MCKIINKFIEWAIPKFIEYKSEAIITIAVGVIMWIIALLQSIPLFYRIPIILFVILCVLLIFQLVVGIYDRFTNPVVLEIIYDNGKYNKRKNIQIKATYDLTMPIHNCFFYVVGIHNISKKTINSISVIIDGNKCIHDSSGQYICDINPGAIELFDMYGETIENQKQGTKITITVTGQDIKPTIKTIIL
jgi:hypothetical protein